MPGATSMTKTIRTATLFCIVCPIAGADTPQPERPRSDATQGQLDVRRQDYGEFIPNQSVLKTPLRIGTQDIRRGLGSHSHSEIVVRLPAPGRRFEAQVGVDHNRDTTDGKGSVEFIVEVDGKAVLKSATLRGGDKPVRIGVDLDGAKEFTLRATDAGDGPFADHADWGEARVTLTDGRTLWLDTFETCTADMVARPVTTAPERTEETPWAAEVKVGPRREAWTLATDDTQLTVGVTADHKLCLFELSSSATGWNWTASGSALPLLDRVDMAGIQHRPDWVFQNGTVDRGDGTRVTLRFSNQHPALELISVWHARGGPGPIRHTMFIRNRADRPVTIFEQESLALHAVGPDNQTGVWYINDDGSLPDDTGVYHDLLTPSYRKILRVSEQQDWIPFVAVDADGAHGLYLGWEWSIGRLTLAGDTAGRGVFLQAGNRGDFQTKLKPGETFDVPPAFLGAYTGDLDDASNRLHKYLFNHCLPAALKNDATYPKVEWNAFAATGKGQGSWDSVESKYYPLIDQIAPLGFEEVVLDVGWWQGDTTNQPHPPAGDAVDWPKGMLAARNHANAAGMRFGLYWNCNPPMTTLEGMQHRRADIRYLFEQFRVDFYRSDGTDGNVLQTGDFGPSTRAQSEQDVGYWQTKGYYDVLDSLYADIPNFSYENCSGGGRIKDYGILRRCFKVQNQDRYYPLDARQSFYDASYALHPMQLAALCGSWAEWQADGSVYEFRSSAMGAAYWHPDAPGSGNGGPVWSDEQKAAIKKAVATYKTKLRPLIRHADLYHIFPRPDGKHWDGIEYYDPQAKKGVVYIFKPAAQPDTMTIRLRGVQADVRYRVVFEDGSNPNVDKRGDELMTGTEVTLRGERTSELMFFEATTSTVR
jgi:hypothetical protein